MELANLGRVCARSVCGLVLCGTLTAAAQAATLHVGPNGAFAQISQAIAASQPGDTIVVEPGTYLPFTVPHALRVLADGSGPVVIGSMAVSGIVVTGVAAGDEVVLSGLEVRTNTVGVQPTALVRIDGVAGTVVLHDMLVQGAFAGVGVRATNCAHVIVLDSRVLDAGPYTSSTAGGAIEAFGSVLSIVDSTVTGDTGGGGAAEAGDHALLVSGGRVEIWRSSLRGGNGVGSKGFGVVSNGGDGIRATNAVITNFGGPDSEVRGGNAGPSGPFGAPGQGGVGVRLATSATAHFQTNVAVSGGFDLALVNQSPAFLADVTSTAQLYAATFGSMAATSARVPVGGSAALEIDGNPGALCALFFALGTGPRLELPGVVGTGVLDLGLFFQTPTFLLDAQGEATAFVGLPFPWLVDQTVWFQAVELSGTQVTITSPALVVVTP